MTQEILNNAIQLIRNGVDIAVCFNDQEMTRLNQSIDERSKALQEEYPLGIPLSDEERITCNKAWASVAEDLQRSALRYANQCSKLRNHFARFLEERGIERFGFLAKVNPDNHYDAILTCPVKSLTKTYLAEAQEEFSDYTFVITIDANENPFRGEVVLV
tara:strand:- start:1125 stop:1604 length:480 start_codon:yes stop_codon:yes gene_type:complete